MGTRFNVLMTIQVPLQQQKKPDSGMMLFAEESGIFPTSVMEDSGDCLPRCVDSGSRSFKRRSAGAPRGTANAARVSRGSEFDVWPGLSVTAPKRNLEDLYEKCSVKGSLADTAFDFMKKDLTAKDMTE